MRPRKCRSCSTASTGTSTTWPRPSRRGAAGEVPGTEVQVLQVPETLPPEVLEEDGVGEARKAFADVPVADPKRLAEADAVVFGCPPGTAGDGADGAFRTRPAGCGRPGR